jgi:hypothetical protein
MIKVVLVGPLYHLSASKTGRYDMRPEYHVIDSLDSESFVKLQELMREDFTTQVIPWWNTDGIRIEIDGDDIMKLDSQFINLPRTINTKTRYYTGDMALFIIMNYQVNT